MGAYSPPSLMTRSLSEQVMREIVAPTVAGMRVRGTPFRGVLFAGLMIGDDGPKVIEFNVRFGDPEAEVILTRLQDDLIEFLWGAAVGALPERAPEFSEDAALAVVMAARGYPGPAPKGSRIGGLREAADLPGVSILHAATRRDGDAILADGGRVLAVTAIGHDLAEARARAYAAVDRVDWPAGFCRRDIGSQAVRGSNFK
jgi:phosphoribosylamine---glycine ligase